MKSKKILCFILFCIFILFAIAITFYIKFNKKSNSNENKADLSNTSKISDETYNRLIEESKNEENKTKALGHIENDWKYMLQDEIELEGKVYKSYYIRYSDYEYGTRYFVEKMFSYMPEYREIIEGFMYDETMICSKEELNRFSYLHMDPVYVAKKEEKIKTITLERYGEFQFIENWITAALVVYDVDGKVEDVIVFNGAVGTNLKSKDGKVNWEVYVCEKLDAYMYNADAYVGFNGQTTGTIYDFVIDSNNEISDIVYIGNSCDNEVFDMYEQVMEGDHLNEKIYVEKQDLSIYDFLDCMKKHNGKSINYRREFGHEHTQINGIPDNPIYFTKEGYVVGVSTGNDSFYYCKYAKEDFLDMDFMERNIDFYPLFIDGEVNPELQKELEEK